MFYVIVLILRTAIAAHSTRMQWKITEVQDTGVHATIKVIRLIFFVWIKLYSWLIPAQTNTGHQPSFCVTFTSRLHSMAVIISLEFINSRIDQCESN